MKIEKSEGNKAKKLRAVCVEFDTKEKFISSHPPPPPVLVWSVNVKYWWLMIWWFDWCRHIHMHLEMVVRRSMTYDRLFWAILWRLIEALASEGVSFFANSLSCFGHILELFLKIKVFLHCQWSRKPLEITLLCLKIKCSLIKMTN